ncbi:MAG: tRNA pseudouridine(38-40) synthase TruA [Thermodesulfovibrionales bacterium]
MRRIRLHLQYDGTGYQGWQSQRSGRTIQDTIESRLSRIVGSHLRITGAGRTDAGVHALGQVAAFSTESALPAETFRRALNATLPADIRVLAAEDADPGFHPRYDAVLKRYSYLLCMNSLPSAFMHRYLWELRQGLDVAAMQAAAALLTGTHDFSAFRGSGCSAKSPVRTVSSLIIVRLEAMPFLGWALPGDFLKIQIEGDAFLRHMVRNIVGTLVETGLGKLPPEAAGEILRSLDRNQAGPTAPAHGLFLEKIFYGSSNNPSD